VLFVAHRSELIRQTVDKLVEAGIPRNQIGVMCASDSAVYPDDVRPNARIQVCSIQTLAARGSVPPAAVVFVDECHHVMAASYRTLLEAYPDAIVYGLTATPKRLDGKGLDAVFEELVSVASVRELIDKNYLAGFTAYGSSETAAKLLKKRMRGVKVKNGDFDEVAVANAMHHKVLIGDAISERLKHAAGLQTVAFSAGVANSKILCARFKRAKVSAAHLDGKTPTK
jgi:superfamily II DNA or RNA helicase